VRNNSDYSQANPIRALFWSSALFILFFSLKTEVFYNLFGFLTGSEKFLPITRMPGLKAKGE